MSGRFVPALLLLALLARPLRADDRLEKADAKERAKIAKVWLGLVADMMKADLKDEALDALERAAEVDPETAHADELRPAVTALPGTGERDAAAERKIDKARSDVAKAYDKLAKLFADESDDPRRIAYQWKAVELDPSKGRVQRLADEAKKDFVLVRAPGSPFVALMSLPKSWRPGKTYPVLVSVEGAGCNFLGNATGFRTARGSRDWITLSPHALSCTNELQKDKYPAYGQALLDEWNSKRVEFDVAGLLGVLDFIGPLFGAEEKIAITGFSGGGNLCYGFTFHHPDRVRCAAPACANFQPGLASGGEKPEGGGPPVHVFTGENDPHRYLTHGKTPPGIEEQTDWAMKAFAERGFEHVERTMLPGVGHSPLPKEVWAFVDEVTAEK